MSGEGFPSEGFASMKVGLREVEVPGLRIPTLVRSLPSSETLGKSSASWCLGFLISKTGFRVVLALKVILWSQ